MSKKSYTPPSLKSERIFQESSLRCVYDYTGTQTTCQKKTACEYPELVNYCSIWPYDS
jgi:hypothetical protein